MKLIHQCPLTTIIFSFIYIISLQLFDVHEDFLNLLKILPRITNAHPNELLKNINENVVFAIVEAREFVVAVLVTIGISLSATLLVLPLFDCGKVDFT